MDQQAREWLVRRAIQAAPYEACGFVLDDGSIVEIRNVSLAPERAFIMDTRDVIDKLDGTLERVAGIWHTHPRGTEHPSSTDLEAIKAAAIAPHWEYIIATTAGVFTYDAGLFAPMAHQEWGTLSDTSVS